MTISYTPGRSARKLISFHKIYKFLCYVDWVDVVRECELSLTTQAPVLHHMHHLTAQTLQQLIYACIGTQAYSTARNTSAVFTIVWLSRGGYFGCYMIIII